MGQKVNPIIFRIGNIHSWKSKWFSKKDYGSYLKQDVLIRKYIRSKYSDASIASIEIERFSNSVTIIIHTSKPGFIIGRGGHGVEELKNLLKKKFVGNTVGLNINIVEVADPNLNAELVAQNMITDIEKRLPYRRVLRQALARMERAGAKGARVMVSGRLNGAEIARSEMLSIGKLPLHTLRADIQYSRGTAHTMYGTIGIKVWIYKGEKFEKNV